MGLEASPEHFLEEDDVGSVRSGVFLAEETG